MESSPCYSIKSTCQKVMGEARHVKINEPQLKQLAENLKTMGDFDSWGKCHYPPEKFSLESLLKYIFTIDTLNYCFWPNAPFEYDDLAKNLFEILKNEPTFFTSERLSCITPQEVKEKIFKCDFCILTERARMLREVFSVIQKYYGGSCIKFVEAAQNDAVKLVKQIVDSFTGFRDQAIHKGCQVFFYKRAQILVSDIYLAYADIKKSVKEEELSKYKCINFGDTIKELTMFADYRVPQLLRARGVLEYSTELSNLIDKCIEIAHSSEYEIEIRAGTIIAVEKLKEILSGMGKNLLSIEIDAYLWQIGEKIKKEILPHHRTLSIFY